MCARGEARLQEAAGEIAAATAARVVPVAGDVSKLADVSSLVGRALADLGRVDVLVTNSGGPPPGTFETTTPRRGRPPWTSC